jgi:hypothetical protein
VIYAIVPLEHAVGAALAAISARAASARRPPTSASASAPTSARAASARPRPRLFAVLSRFFWLLVKKFTEKAFLARFGGLR